MRLIRRPLAVWLLLLSAAVPQSALAQCMANAHVDHVAMENGVRTTHCRCNSGFEPHGNACVKKCDDGYQNQGGRCALTVAGYEDALENCQRMVDTRRAFRRKIEDLRKWQGNLARYKKEYEAARADAWRGGLSDILSAIPGERLGVYLTTKYALAAHFTPRLVTGLSAAKALVSFSDVPSAAEDSERVKKIGEGHAALREALLTIPAEAANEEAKKLLRSSGHLFEASIKVVAFAVKQQNEKSGPPPSLLDRSREWLETGAEIWGVFDPRMGGALAGTNIALRPAKWLTARSAISDMNAALDGNWNAQRYLAEKIGRLTDAIRDDSRTIDAYRAAGHPEARTCRQD